MNRRNLCLGVGASVLGLMTTGAMLGAGSNFLSMVDSWTGGTGKIYYTGGDIGIGTSTPSWQLHSLWTGTAEGAIYGQSTATTGSNAYGVEGRSTGDSGTGVYGVVTADSGLVHGVVGETDSTGGRGVLGWARATTGACVGVRGENESAAGTGVFGVSNTDGASDTNYGVWGWADGGTGRGLQGNAAHTSGANYGVFATSASSAGTGVYGEATANSGTTFGVSGKASSGSGVAVYGENDAASGSPLGVYGTVALAGGAGVLGDNSGSGTTIGMQGQVTGSTATGVIGIATSTASSTQNKGVYGEARSELGIGVKGLAVHATGVNYGVLGQTNSTTNGYGVYSSGRFAATGTKSFQIDHPLDPEHLFLNHFCTEGPEPYLIYRGNVTLDGSGKAWVELPDYFEAINRDYAYQLTPVGTPGLVYIEQEIENGAFLIAGGMPGGKVSWSVTGVRNDAFVRANPLPAEQPKPADQVGKYVTPSLFGKPPEDGIFFDSGAAAISLPANSTAD